MISRKSATKRWPSTSCLWRCKERRKPRAWQRNGESIRRTIHQARAKRRAAKAMKKRSGAAITKRKELYENDSISDCTQPSRFLSCFWQVSWLRPRYCALSISSSRRSPPLRRVKRALPGNRVPRAQRKRLLKCRSRPIRRKKKPYKAIADTKPDDADNRIQLGGGVHPEVSERQIRGAGVCGTDHRRVCQAGSAEDVCRL